MASYNDGDLERLVAYGLPTYRRLALVELARRLEARAGKQAGSLSHYPDQFTNTEASRPVMLPPIGEADEPPKGLGWDGNKPLMRNRTGQ